MARLNWTRIGLHVTFWLIYLPINAVVSCILRGANIEKEFGMALVGEAFSLPLKLVFTYFVFYYVIPLYLERSKIWQLVSLLLASFCVATILYRMEIGWVFFPIFYPSLSIDILSPKGLMLTLFDLFITLAAAVTVKMIRMHYKSLEFEQQLIREKLQSELNFLRAQTNPHFLFNTLNSISTLVLLKQTEPANAMLSRLSSFLRYTLVNEPAGRVTVAQEVDTLKLYLEIERMRFEERLRTRFQIEAGTEHALLPSLLLQPLVENAIKYAVSPQEAGGSIDVSATRDGDLLRICIEDDGPGLPSEGDPRRRRGVGLAGVRRGRLEHRAGILWGSHAQLS